MERLHILTHSSIEEYRNDGDDADRLYLPWRAAAEAAARMRMGERVLTILPQYEAFNEYLTLLEQTLLRGRKINHLNTSDTEYLMDDDIRKELLGDLRKVATPQTLIHPYQATPEFYKWADPLSQETGAQVYSDRKEREDRRWFGHKGAYHRWMDDLETPGLAEELNLPFPNGYVAQNPEELAGAVRLLQAEAVVLKPIFGAGGFQIAFCSTPDDLRAYSAEWPEDPITGKRMPLAVQEKVKIGRDEQGERAYSIQFERNKVFGRLTRQRMDGAEWNGNVVPAEVAPEFERATYIAAERLISHVNPQGDGGIDIADVNGQPVFIEVNGGRPTGAHMPKRFKEAFAPSAPHFVFQKVDVGQVLTAHEVWDGLNRCTTHRSDTPLAFNENTQRGVYPIVWLQGMWGMLASFGESYDQAENQLLQAQDKLGLGGRK